MSRKLLSINIPTYNRPEELEKNLKILSAQYSRLEKRYQDEICVFVSDNQSFYDFYSLMHKYKTIMPLKYNQNTKNIGSSANFEQCYLQAFSESEYVWLIADDDYLVEGALVCILKYIEKYTPDIIYVNYTSKRYSDPSITVYSDGKKFVADINYKLTMVSGIIIQRKYISIEDNIFMPVHNNVSHLYFVLQAAYKSKVALLINDRLLDRTENNTGGYDVFDTFSKDLYAILNYFYKYTDFIPYLIAFKGENFKNILVPYFFYAKLETSSYQSFKKVNINKTFIALFRQHYSEGIFWWTIVPMFFTPQKILFVFHLLYKKFNIQQFVRS